MYLYTLKQLWNKDKRGDYVVNRFKKNVSLHVETTALNETLKDSGCESL